MLSVSVVVATMWAGQMLDGHVHRQHHGGVLAHCSPDGEARDHRKVALLELVIRQRGEREPAVPKQPGVPGDGTKAPDVPEVDVEVWLLSENEAAMSPKGWSLRLRVSPTPDSVPLQLHGNRFKGRLGVPAALGTLVLEATLNSLKERTRVCVARLNWTVLDDRERMNDALVPGAGRIPKAKPRGLNLLEPRLVPRSTAPLPIPLRSEPRGDKPPGRPEK